ncbi:AAA family ATPase [Flocculibacter collagenilyticus]|uniref:AAA family ATPase n=1 Tax=Flocculibacter collagenilyticus TaxID=2744479 RepID=UPI0018F3C526|nr:AAA family ATPase [Flocculibacter collagenilyticus]
MHTLLGNVITQINKVVLGKEHQVKLALACLLAKGHLLIEDLPGMGKTTLSHALADSLGLSYQRAQFTSDLLPADIIGVSTFNQKTQSFDFHQGPVFNQVLLCDEINRASPKTQSALLEAMEEKQVSIDGQTHQLPSPFFVIATQNPLHQSGTFPLPESQLDRFLMTISLDYPARTAELAMLKGAINPLSIIETVLSPEQLSAIQSQVEEVMVSDVVLNYILDLVTLSRTSAEIPNPLSPRASKSLVISAKAWAVIDGRDYVTHDDVQTVLGPVCEHRMRAETELFTQHSNYSKYLIESVPVRV